MDVAHSPAAPRDARGGIAMAPSRPRTWTRVLLLVLISAVIAFVLPRLWQSAPTRNDAAAPTLLVAAPTTAHVRRETRATLDPARFVGKAALGYQVAREIPEVLDQVYCYCGCDGPQGHR